MPKRLDELEFTIVQFEPRFIPLQAELGRIHTRDWKYYSQSDHAYLTKFYAQEDFDPKTRFYFINRETSDTVLYGFLTSKINDKTAHLAPPIVKENEISGYSHKVALMKHAMQALSKLGVKKLIFTSSPSWGDTDQLIKEFNFKFDNYLFQEYTGRIESFLSILETNDLDHITPNIKNYTDIYKSKVIQPLSTILEMNYQEMEKTLENNMLPNLKQEIAKVLLNQENEVVGWIRGSVITENSDTVLSITPGYIFDSKFENYRPKLIRSVIAEATNQGVENFKLVITERTQSQIGSLDLSQLDLSTEIKKYILEFS